MLSAFDGTILFVSHDRYFIDRIATRIWAIEVGAVKQYLGNYTDYQRQLGRRPETPAKEPERTKDAPDAKSEAGQDQRQHARQPVQDGKVQKSLLQVEREIARLEGKLNELSDALTVAGIDADVDAVSRLGAEYERIQNELEASYGRWEELTAQFEAMAVPASR
jgi:ATP-binding cassette subfamily F protein 3